MTGWCVLSTLSRQERRPELNLWRQGYRAWLPLIERVRRIDEKGHVAVTEAGFKLGAKVRLIVFVNCIAAMLKLAVSGRLTPLGVFGQEVATIVSRRILVPAF
jgi:hypothetical protein